MVLDPIPQSLPVHFFGSRPQPPTSQTGLFLKYIGGFPACIGLFNDSFESAQASLDNKSCAWRPTCNSSLQCRLIFSEYKGLFQQDIGLFLLCIGLFSEYIGLFLQYIGLFSENIELLKSSFENVGLFNGSFESAQASFEGWSCSWRPSHNSSLGGLIF